MNKLPSVSDATPVSAVSTVLPVPPHPAAAVGPAHFAGGIVTLGGYKADAPGWGRREVYLGPFNIDAKATSGPDAKGGMEECLKRGGRVPRAEELEHALRAGLVERNGGRERTSSVAIPRDSDALTAAEGVGFYPVLLDGPEQLILVGPEEELGLPARCLVPQETPPEPIPRVLAHDIQPRRGRGAEWPPVTGFFALGEHHDVPPLMLRRGSHVGVLHESDKWVLISALPDSTDPLGWTLAVDLLPAKPAAKSGAHSPTEKRSR